MKTILSGLCLLLGALHAQPRVTAPLFPHKDGEADALSYSGINKDLEVDGGGNPVVSWMTYQLQGVDRVDMDSAFLTLYVRTVTAPGSFRVFALSQAISKPENSVNWNDLFYDTSASLATASLSGASIEQIVALNVTPAVKLANFHGLVLVSKDGLQATFGSKESPMKPHVMLAYRALQGPQGDSGARGQQGFTGLKGDKGDKGDSGTAGPNAVTLSTAISDTVIAYRHLKKHVLDSLREWIRQEYGLLSSQYSWKIAGTAGFGFGMVSGVSMAFSPTGAPYVAAYEVGNGLAVKFFNGSSWINVGGIVVPGLGAIQFPSLAITTGGMPYVAFSDARFTWKATVMRYNGTAWENVGTTGFSAGAAYNHSLALSSSGQPYLFFRDVANGDRATVMRYNGTAWELVGAAGFSAGSSGIERSLVLNYADTPYVAFADAANGFTPAVMRFNGTIWQNVGAAAFAGSSGEYISMALSSSGIPYVAYSDGFTAPYGRISVKRYMGGIWENVGVPRFTSGEARFNSLAISASGRPYVAFKDMINNGKVSVMRYFGSGWESVGPLAFTPGGAVFSLSLAVSPDETPYVDFEDVTAGSRATVMRFIK